MAPGGSPAIPPTAVSSERRSQSNQPLNPLGGAPVDLWITLRVAHNPTGPSTTYNVLRKADIFTCYRQLRGLLGHSAFVQNFAYSRTEPSKSTGELDARDAAPSV